jgi:hypothetical protein
MKFLRSPLVQFLLVGAVIFFVYSFFEKKEEEGRARTIVINAQELEWLETTWKKRWMRPPTEAEREGIIRQYVQENILYREAMALGLDKDDPVIRRMMAQKLERMVQDLASGVEPTDEELKGYFELNKADYIDPERITITQIFFDPDQRGDNTLTDAEAAKATLMALENPAEGGAALGDSFMLQRYFPGRTEMEIAKVLGGGFAESVFKLSDGTWHGPVLSGYGTHLVYVHGRQTASAPEFDVVKERVLSDYLTQKRIEARDLFIEGLFEKYEVVVEEGSEIE